jgi:hypothetical protein
MSDSDRQSWWKAEKDCAHELLLDYVHAVEQRQAHYFDRFGAYEAMYDPNGPAAQAASPRWQEDAKRITENVIASCIDTVCAAVSTTDIRARFMTDGADWNAQQRARLLDTYSEEVGKLLNVMPRCRSAFFGAAKKGTGPIKVYADEDGEVHVETLLVDNVIVDDAETQNGAEPRMLHYRQVDYDRDLLIQQFPEHEDAIDRAQQTGAWRRRWQRWAVQGVASRNDVCVVESWRLPIGKRGTARYVPGRHVICVDGATLLDEEWHKPHFPIVAFRWWERTGSWYGIGLAERIVGHQRTINKRNWHRDQVLDLLAVPTIYVRPADAHLRFQTTRIGNVVPVKGEYPKTEVPNVVGAEISQDRYDAKASAFEETGVSRMAASAMKPAGLDSGAALREHKDQNSQRFAVQELNFETFVLQTIALVLDTCKDLGDRAPKMVRKSRFKPRQLPWSDVDMGEVRVQITAASTLSRTPAGRVQTVLEFAQAGVISTDEARRLLRHPDLEHALSMYTASLEAIERDLSLIEEGEFVVPEPFLNLDMAVKVGTNRYLTDRDNGAPEEVLEGIRTYIVQAAELLKRKAAPPMPMDPMMAGAGMMPGMAPPMLPPGAGAPPMTAPQQVPAMAPPTLPLPPP